MARAIVLRMNAPESEKAWALKYNEVVSDNVHLMHVIAKLKTGQRGAKSKLTRLKKRTRLCMATLDTFIEPKLMTKTKQKYHEAVRPVKKLLKEK